MIVPLVCNKCGKQTEAEKTVATNVVTCPECGANAAVPIGLTVGCVIGHGYRLDRRIDETAQGETYIATQTTMHREVLVKVLSPAYVHDDETLARFAREVKLTARLNHPNILSAIDAGEDAGVRFLVTENKPGLKLSDYLIAHGNRLDEKTAVKMMIPIAEALDHAWGAQQILHRNLKPENILISAEGTPYLMNLGIAKSLEGDQMNVTGTGFTVGTPDYMSPEQIQADMEIDFRADMYSIGVVLYQCVTGMLPFSDPNPVALMSKHLEEDPVPAHEANGDVSSACSKLIGRMLAKSPADRPRSWSEAVDEMKALSKKSSKPKGPKNIASLKAVQDEAKRASLEHRASARETENGTRHGNGLRIALLGMIIVLCLVVATAIALKKQPPPIAQAPNPQLETTDTPLEEPEQGDTGGGSAGMSPTVKQSYDRAIVFYAENPDQFALAIRRLEKIAAVAAGCPGETLARDMIERIKEDQVLRQQEITTALEARARAKMAQGQVEEGLSVLKGYDGPLAEETTQQRWQIVSKLTQNPPAQTTVVEEKPQQDAAQVRSELSQGLTHILTALRDARADEALIIAESLVQNEAMCELEPRLKSLHALTKAFADVDTALLEAISGMTGKAMKLWDSEEKVINLRFKGVDRNVILAERLIVDKGKIKGSVLIRVPPAEIHPRGYIKIFSASALPYGESLSALIAWQAGQKDYAKDMLQKSKESTAALVLAALNQKP